MWEGGGGEVSPMMTIAEKGGAVRVRADITIKNMPVAGETKRFL